MGIKYNHVYSYKKEAEGDGTCVQKRIPCEGGVEGNLNKLTLTEGRQPQPRNAARFSPLEPLWSVCSCSRFNFCPLIVMNSSDPRNWERINFVASHPIGQFRCSSHKKLIHRKQIQTIYDTSVLLF